MEDFEDEESQEVELTPEETTNFHVGTISDLLTKYLDVYSSLNSLIAGGELDDAINTSAILVLMQDDAKFKATMQPVLDILQPQEDLSSSIGELCPDLLKLKNNIYDN